MATTYKGLTIRIGGDTTKLSRALREANAALAQTQYELKKTTKAAKLDPSSIGAYNAQLGYMSQRATNVASKLAVLKRSIEQVNMSEKTVSVGGTLKSYQELINAASEFGDGAEDSAVKLAQANEVFNLTTENLSRTHREMSKLSKAATQVEESIISDAMSIVLEGKKLDEVIDKYRQLSDGTARSSESLNSISDQISQISKLFAPGENGMFDVDAIKKYFATLGSSVGISKTYVNELLDVIKSINEEYSNQAELSGRMASVMKAQQAERDKADLDRLTELESEIEERDTALSQIIANRRAQERELIDAATIEYRESINSDVTKTTTSYEDALSIASAITEQTRARKDAQAEINRLQNQSKDNQAEINRELAQSNVKLASLRKEEEDVVESVKRSIRQRAYDEYRETFRESDEYKEGVQEIKLKASADRASARAEVDALVAAARERIQELEKKKDAVTLHFDVADADEGRTLKEISDEAANLFGVINDTATNNNIRTLIKALSESSLSSYRVVTEDLDGVELLDYISYLEQLKETCVVSEDEIGNLRNEIDKFNKQLAGAMQDRRDALESYGIDPDLEGDELEDAMRQLNRYDFGDLELQLEPIDEDITNTKKKLGTLNDSLLELSSRRNKFKETVKAINAEIDSINTTGESSNSEFLSGWINNIERVRKLLKDLMSDKYEATWSNPYPAITTFNNIIGHVSPEEITSDYEKPIDAISKKVVTLIELLDSFSKTAKTSMTHLFDSKEIDEEISGLNRTIANSDAEIRTRRGRISREETKSIQDYEAQLLSDMRESIDDSLDYATDAEKKMVDNARAAIEAEERHIESLNGKLSELGDSYGSIATGIIDAMRSEQRFGKDAFTFDFLEGLDEKKLTDIASALHNRIVSINVDLESARENIRRLSDFDYKDSMAQKAVDEATKDFAGEDPAEMSAKRRAEYEEKINDARSKAYTDINNMLTEEQRTQRTLLRERQTAEAAISAIRERSIAAYDKDVTQRMSDQEKLVAFERKKLAIQKESEDAINSATEAHGRETEALVAEASELRGRLLESGVIGGALTVEEALGASESDWKEATERIAECRGEIETLVQESNESVDKAAKNMSDLSAAVASSFNDDYEEIMKRGEEIAEYQAQLTTPHLFVDAYIEKELQEIEDKFKSKPKMFVAWRDQFTAIMKDIESGAEMTADESAEKFRELFGQISKYMEEIDTSPFDSLESQFRGIRKAAISAAKLATGDAQARIKEFSEKTRSILTSYTGTVLKNINKVKNNVNLVAEQISSNAYTQLYERYNGGKRGLLGIQESDIAEWRRSFDEAIKNAIEGSEALEARERELAELQDVVSGSGNSPDNERAKRIAELQVEINELQEKQKSTIADTVGEYDGMSDAVRRLRMEQAHIIDAAVNEVRALQTDIDETTASTTADVNKIREAIKQLEIDRDKDLAVYDDDGTSFESTRIRELKEQIEETERSINELDTAFDKFKKSVDTWDVSDEDKQRTLADREERTLRAKAILTDELGKKESELEETRNALAARRAAIESKFQSDRIRYYDEISAKEAELRSEQETYLARRAEIIRKANEESAGIELEIQGNTIDVEALQEAAMKAIRQAMIEALGKKMPKLSSEIFNVDNGNTGMNHLTESIEAMARNVDMSDASVERLTGTLTDLTERLGESQNAIEAFGEVLRIKDTINEITLAEAELRKQLDDIGNIDGPSELSKRLYTLNSTIEKISSAYSSLLKRGDTFDKYLEIDSGNVDIAEVALNAVTDAARAAMENIQTANDRLGYFDVERIHAITDASKSAEKQLIDSESAWLTAATNLKQYEGRLVDVRNEISRLEDQMSRSKIDGTEVVDAINLSDEDIVLGGLEEPSEALARLRIEEERLDTLTKNLGVNVRALWKEFDAAKERRDFEDATAEVTQWRVELQKVSATIVDMTQKKAVSEIFGDTSELDGFSERLKAAIARVDALNKITDLGDKNDFGSANAELARRRFEALADVESIVVMYSESLNDVLNTIDTSSIDKVAEKYGSVETAVGRVIQKYGSLQKAMAEFVKGNDDELLVDVEDIARADALLQRLRSIKDLNTEIDAARKLVKDSDVSSYKPFDFDRDIFDSAVKALETLKTTSEGAFEPIDRRFKNLTAVIEDAKSKVRAYDDQMKASGETAELVAARDREIERAVAAADERAKLLPESIEKVNAGLESMGRVGAEQRLIETYGNLGNAIDSLGKKFVGVQAQANAFRNAIMDFANENELGEEWAKALIRVASKGDISDSILDMIFADLPESIEDGADKLFGGIHGAVSGLRESLANAGDIAEDLGLASILKYFQSIEAKSMETGDVVRESFSKEKVKIEVDDTKLKELEALSKRAKDFGFSDTGIDDELEDLKAMGTQIKSNSDYYEELLKLFKENPRSEFVKTELLQSAEALMEKYRLRIEKTHEAVERLKELIDSGDFDIDFEAMKSGTVDAELEKAENRFDEAKEKVKSLREELKKAKQTFKDTKTESARKEVERLEIELSEAEEAAEDAGETFRRELNTKYFVQIQIDEVTDVAKAENLGRQVTNGFHDAEKDAQNSSTEIMQAIQNIWEYAERAGQRIVESANTIDAAYRDMRKTVDGTEAQFQALHDAAIKFSQTNAVSADTLLSMEALGGQLGITVDRLQEFGEVSSHLDIATDIDAETIALQLGQMTNIMNDLNFDTFDNFADALVRLGNNTATTESKIMNVAERLAAIANVTSMTTPQLLGWSAAIASTGQRAESAATAVSNSITGIGQAVAENGQALEQFAKIAGMSADEFREKWSNSSSEALEGFVKGLGSLTDDSTAAIEALDSVGISSVRQETALLALSQTVGNLDNAMRYASEGFNNGGDAAREAAEKSKGFSGTLSILQNNVTNLGEALGEGLIPFIQVASTALELLTNLLNSMSGPMKTMTVGIAGIAAAFSAIAPTIDSFMKGWKSLAENGGKLTGLADTIANGLGKIGTPIYDLFSKLKNGKTAVTESAEELLKVGEAAENVALSTSDAATSVAAMGATSEVAAVEASAATGSVTGLGTASAGAAVGVTALKAALGGLVIMVGSLIISWLVGEFMKWKEHTDLVRKATTDLSATISEIGPNIESYSQRVNGAAKSLEELKSETDSILQSQADFADTVKNTWTEFETSAAVVAELSSTIVELCDKEKLTKDEQTKLRAAVKAYNDETGESIEIIDALNGKLNISSDELKKNSDAWYENAKSQAAYDLYVESIEKRARAEVQLAVIDKELGDATTELAQQTGVASDANAIYGGQFASDVTQTTKLAKSRSDLTEQQAELNAIIDEASDFEEELLTLMGEDTEAAARNKEAIQELENALNSVGDSTKNYANVSDEKLVEVANAYGDNIEAAIRKLKELNEVQNEVNTETVKPSDQEYEAFKRKNEQLYTEEERLRDDFYDNDERLRDLYYDKREAELDDEYDMIKNQLDDAYEYEKRIRDTAYEERENQLDDQYEEEKRKRDDAYDDYKDQLDDLYDYEKEVRDDAYDDAKDAMDDWLDDYKDALDAEVDAFEDATDARIDLMEEEYEAKKKLIEDQEEADTADIDARIQAIDDLTEAEEKAAELAEREEKIAEATAKRDKYSEGSKAWEKYNTELENLLTEYHNEDVKEQREEYKDYLEGLKDDIKDQADERKDALKDSYDAEKEAYQASRDEQKEILKEYNEDVYNEEKRLKEAELELYKEAQEAELTIIERSHEDKLEVMQRIQEDELENIQRQQDLVLDEYKNAQEDELTAIDRFHEEQLEDVKSAQEAHLELLKHYHELELLGLKRSHEDELTEIKNHLDDENEAYKNGGQAAVDALNAAADAAKTASEKVSKSITDAADSVGTLDNISTESKKSITSAMESIKEGLTSDDPKVVEATKGLVTKMSDELYKIVAAAHNSGVEVPVELSQAIVESSGLTRESLDSLVNTVTGSFGPITPAARTEMESAILAISETLSSKTPETVAAAEQFVSENAVSLTGLVNAAESIGIEVPGVLANALSENTAPTEEAVNSLISKLLSPIGTVSSEAEGEMKEMLGVINTSLSSDDPNRTNAARTLVKSISDELAVLVEIAEKTGEAVPPAIYAALASDAWENDSVGKAATYIQKYFETLQTNMETLGGNAMDGWTLAFASAFTNNAVPVVERAAEALANRFKTKQQISSPSKLFAWFAEMDVKGFMDQWDRSSDGMVSMVGSTADMVAKAFDVSTTDPMSELLEAMRQREDDLKAQSERMARIMEDGFDPTLTAAYEAVDTIDDGQFKRQQSIAAAQSVSNVTNAPVINITIPEVVVREQADITQFSEQIARRVRRELAASLG